MRCRIGDFDVLGRTCGGTGERQSEQLEGVSIKDLADDHEASLTKLALRISDPQGPHTGDATRP